LPLELSFLVKAGLLPYTDVMPVTVIIPGFSNFCPSTRSLRGLPPPKVLSPDFPLLSFLVFLSRHRLLPPPLPSILRVSSTKKTPSFGRCVVPTLPLYRAFPPLANTPWASFDKLFGTKILGFMLPLPHSVFTLVPFSLYNSCFCETLPCGLYFSSYVRPPPTLSKIWRHPM